MPVVHFWCGTIESRKVKKTQKKPQKNLLRLLVAAFLLPPTIKNADLRLSQPVY
jgi:hypothetical protein